MVSCSSNCSPASEHKFSDYQLFKESLNALLHSKSASAVVIIVSGFTEGAEMLGERYAAEKGFEVAEEAAMGEISLAAVIRTSEMAGYADPCICFWEGQRPLIKGRMDIVTDAGVRLDVVIY